jgi:hypothetical protein
MCLRSELYRTAVFPKYYNQDDVECGAQRQSRSNINLQSTTRSIDVYGRTDFSKVSIDNVGGADTNNLEV